MFLCTSNLVDCLDSAFLDRCGVKLAVEPPFKTAQYAILCRRVQKSIRRRVIRSEVVLPQLAHTQNDLMTKIDGPGSKILHIVCILSDNICTAFNVLGVTGH